VNRLMNLLICITKENYNMPKNRIVKNRPSYCVSAKETASWLRRIGQKARKQRSDAGKKRR
jgi:hypothetical protein